MPTYASLVKISNLPAATLPTTPGTNLAVLSQGSDGLAYKVSINDFVSGATASSFTIGTATVTGNASVGGTLSVTGTSTLGTVNASGAVALNSTLNVVGTSTLGVVNASGVVTLSSAGAALVVTNNATVGGTFGVTGTSTLGVVNASGVVTLSSAGTALVVTNNATVGGTLGVTGATTMTGLLTASTGAIIGSDTFAGVELALNGSAASLRPIRWRSVGVDRMSLGMNGANSDLVIGRYFDTGVLIENALTISRETGFITAAKSIGSSTRVTTPKIQNSSTATTAVTSLSGDGAAITVGYSGAALAVGTQITLTNNTPATYDGLYVVAASPAPSSGSFTVAGTATGTVTELGAFITYNNSAQSWTGSTYPNDYAAFIQRYTPSGTPASGLVAYNYYAISTDTVDGTNAAATPAGIRVDHNFGGAIKGGRFGLIYNLTQTSATDAGLGTGPPGGDFIPGTFFANFAFNNGGTGHDIGGGPNKAKGGAYALYPQIVASAGATFWDHFVGAEWDFQIKAAPNHKIGQHIVLLAGDSAQGVYNDVAFAIAGDEGVPGWRSGISFGERTASMALDPLATLIEIPSRLNASNRNNLLLNGVNIQLANISGSAFTSVGFGVTGDGSINTGPLAISRTATTSAVDSKRFKAAISGISSGGAGYQALQEIYILGGIIRIDTVVAGAVTAATIIKDIYQDAVPSNPQGGSGGGGGDGTAAYFPANQAKFNFTWTQITTLQLQASGGVTIFGNATTPITPTSAGTTYTPNVQILATGAAASSATARFSANANGSRIALVKSRNASIGGHTAVQSADDLGRFEWYGDDGTDYLAGARVSAIVDGAVSAGVVPTALVSYTAASGSTPTERFRIGSDGILQGAAPSWSANGAVATVLTGIGPTGSHTTVQEWFTVKNAAGVTRYIPAF